MISCYLLLKEIRFLLKICKGKNTQNQGFSQVKKNKNNKVKNRKERILHKMNKYPHIFRNLSLSNII